MSLARVFLRNTDGVPVKGDVLLLEVRVRARMATKVRLFFS